MAEEGVLGGDVGVGAGRQKSSSWYLLQMGLLHCAVLLHSMGTARLGRSAAFCP